MNMEETEVGRVRKKLKRLMDKKHEDHVKAKSVASVVTAVMKKGQAGGGDAGEQTQQTIELGSVKEEETSDVRKTDGAEDDLETGVATLTLSSTDEVDGVNVGGEAIVSAMPLPTEESAGVLPKLGLRRGSFYKKLME